MHPLRRKRKKPGINILPLLDVLTVILFFFLITMQFKSIGESSPNDEVSETEKEKEEEEEETEFGGLGDLFG